MLIAYTEPYLCAIPCLAWGERVASCQHYLLWNEHPINTKPTQRTNCHQLMHQNNIAENNKREKNMERFIIAMSSSGKRKAYNVSRLCNNWKQLCVPLLGTIRNVKKSADNELTNNV